MRNGNKKALEITWHDADPVMYAFITIFVSGILFAVLAQAFSNIWILTLIWLTPIAMALGVFVHMKRTFWTRAERLLLEPRNRIQSFSPTVAIWKLDIDSILFDVTVDTSGEDPAYAGRISVIRRDGSTVPLVALSPFNNAKMQYIRTRMMAEWISNQLGVPCMGGVEKLQS